MATEKKVAPESVTVLDDRPSSVEFAFEKGRAFGQPVLVDNDLIKMVRVYEGENIKLVRGPRTAPVRKAVVVTMRSADSFIDYVNEHQDGSSRIFVSGGMKLGDVPTMTAYLDYHRASANPTDARWLDHVCRFKMEFSREFEDWTKFAGRAAIGQEELANFIEDHTRNIVRPSAALMMEVALNLEASKAGQFRSSIRQQSGSVSLVFDEQVSGQAATSSGKIEVPDRMGLSLRPFLNSEAIEIDCLIRFRLSQGKLMFLLKMLDVEALIEDHIHAVADVISEKTKLPLFYGSVEPTVPSGDSASVVG